jgi:hypothetical protein
MRQLGHRSRTDEKRQFDALAQHRGCRIDVSNISQQPGTEPYPIEETLIRIPRYEIRGCRRVKRPCLLRQRFLGYGFKVVAVYQTAQWWLSSDLQFWLSG